jgi:hypothetical protein
MESTETVVLQNRCRIILGVQVPFGNESPPGTPAFVRSFVRRLACYRHRGDEKKKLLLGSMAILDNPLYGWTSLQ